MVPELQVKPTEAVYTLRDPVEVMSFLDNLVAWGRTEDNAWHTARCCNGWRLNTEVAPAHAAAATQLFRGDSGGCTSEMSDTGERAALNDCIKIACSKSILRAIHARSSAFCQQ